MSVELTKVNPIIFPKVYTKELANNPSLKLVIILLIKSNANSTRVRYSYF